jgi:hypothetical protein
MDEPIRYRGRAISAEELGFIRDLIAQHPQASRWRLSKLLCEAWGWRHANGTLRDVYARGFMLALHRGGHVELPARKRAPREHPGRRRQPATDILVDRRPIGAALSELGSLSFRQVRRRGDEPLFDGLIESHHYLGYTQPVGEHLKYLVYAGDRPVACLAWSSAPWHMGPRDRFIGWTPAVRRRNLQLLAYNSRFLILPWVRVRHLASHILGQMARRLSADWQAVYGHPIYYLETFVDRERFAGSCYRAANWCCLGQTTGRGIKDKAHKVTLSIKDVLGYPLRRDFRRCLCAVAARRQGVRA